ncbi:uncharacterized protein DUF2625 [Actinoplanes lutulentus]|uniref:Uncharacterized protein DUF2625 n=1 Tax=Actinoplanes lutulentus TaxID=1287878 RepID=A0A327Z8R6_9ACTN|nr:DUF2625 family protein [Actinoplanes lutulentus]RAK27527.1 uncharacterized protein DUF2625 [Actinoplanes lutulentus]
MSAQADPALHGLIVAYDVLGGQFAWIPSQPGAAPTVHYFAPDSLEWEDLEQGYADWLYAVLAGSMTRFYDNLRWPGWQGEVGVLPADQGITVSRHLGAEKDKTYRPRLGSPRRCSNSPATTKKRHGNWDPAIRIVPNDRATCSWPRWYA